LRGTASRSNASIIAEKAVASGSKKFVTDRKLPHYKEISAVTQELA